jgi:hypothetical protein
MFCQVILSSIIIYYYILKYTASLGFKYIPDLFAVLLHALTAKKFGDTIGEINCG